MSRVSEALSRAAENSRPQGEDRGPSLPPVSRSSVVSVLEENLRAGLSRPRPDRELKTESSGTVAQPAGSRPRLKDLNRCFDDKLVISDEASPVCRDQYRRLAAALQDIQERSRWAGTADAERGLKTLLVTSALPHEGKTLTAVNLALTLADAFGRRVLLIDANLRGPAVQRLLRLPDSIGLSEVLQSATSGLPLQPVLPLLSVLPAGQDIRDTDADLAGAALEAVMKEAASRFDWVIVDAPAVSLLPDAAGLAGLARAVLLVIRSGFTPHRTVERAIARLGRGCILGTVLNRVEEHAMAETGS